MSELSDVGVVSLFKTNEPRLDIKADRDFLAVMGAANISTIGYSANSASTGQIVWSQTTPSVRNGVDRTVELDLTVTITPQFSGGAANTVYRIKPMSGENGAANGVKAGLRSFPLHSICQTITARLNDQAFSWEPAEQLHGLLEYGLTPEDRQYSMGSTPHYPDQQWRYTENTGVQRAVFSSWMNNTFEDSRNVGIWMTGGGSDGANPASVQVRLIEQMMLSPFVYGEEVQCFFGIQNIDVALTFKQPLERMLCGAWMPNMIEKSVNGGAWQAVTTGDDPNLVFSPQFAFAQNSQKLHITYLQPQINQVIPWRLNYPYWQIQKFSQNVGGVGVNANQIPALGEFTVEYNNVTLHNIPKRMYLFAQPDLIQTLNAGANYFGTPTENDAANSNINQAQSDTFARIRDKGLVINFDTQDGRFSTYDAYDLYKVCSSNGLKRSYKAWQDYVGSVMCVEFGKDLNLNPLLCPGTRGNFQLSASVKYQDIRNVNLTPDPSDSTQTGAKTYKAFMIIVNVGIVTIQNQLITSSIGSLTEIQVEQAPWLKEGYRHHYRDVAGNGSGKNVWSAIKTAAKKASPYVSPVADIIGDVAGLSDDPRAKVASKVAKVVGKATSGRGTRSSGGSIIVGGKRMSSHSLSRRM